MKPLREWKLRIRVKLLLAFMAVALLSIMVGVFVPLRVIAWEAPRVGKESLDHAYQSIFNTYQQLVLEPQEVIIPELSEDPDFILAFELRNSSAVFRKLQQYGEANSYHFISTREGFGEFPRFGTRARPRLVRIFTDPEEYTLKAEELDTTPDPQREIMKLIPAELEESSSSYYLAGSPVAVRNEDGELLGGVIIGAPLIRWYPGRIDERDYYLDDDLFTEYEEAHGVLIEAISWASLRFRTEAENFEPLYETVVEMRKPFYTERELGDPKNDIGNVLSQIQYIPVEDTSGNLIDVLRLHIPVPPETLAWRSLSGVFYYFGMPMAVVLATVMAYFVSQTISKPINRLSQGAEALSKGDLNYEIDVNTNDEVGELASTFVHMRNRLKQTLQELHQRAQTIEEKNIALDRSVAEISRMRDFMENILRSIGDGVVTFDLSGQITTVNPAARKILNISENANLLEWTEGIDPRLKSIAEGVLKSGQPVERQELRVDRFEGQPVTIELSVHPLKSEERTIGAVVTFYDLTQVLSLKEQIRRQEQLAALGTLSAGIAHEIRNPLGIIKGSAEILYKRFGHLKEEEGLTEFIVEEVKRLSTVLTDFLDFARPHPPNFEPTDINQTLLRSLRLANLPSEDGGIEKQVELEDDIPPISADGEQCQQAFLNLILNAIQSMQQGGVLTLRSRYFPGENGRPGTVEVEIADNGEGMDEQTRASIFNPFFTTKDQGTGLGLSIVHRIVENHHARISVESARGQGTSFKIQFTSVQGKE